jgi:hypothetical protein
MRPILSDRPKTFGRYHSMLNRVINADATDRRYHVSGIADQQ